MFCFILQYKGRANINGCAVYRKDLPHSKDPDVLDEHYATCFFVFHVAEFSINVWYMHNFELFYSFRNSASHFKLLLLHHVLQYVPPPLDNVRVMVIVWRLRGNLIRTALCSIVWHNVHSQQHTYMSSSYRSNRLGLSHLDPCAVHRGGCLELYYCNMVEWFWWD